jgi:hypothetical protein
MGRIDWLFDSNCVCDIRRVGLRCIGHSLVPTPQVSI